MLNIDKKKIADKLGQMKGSIVMCADGFIDEVWELVDSRSSVKDYKLIGVMNQFAERIAGAGTGGMGIELIKKRRAFGGFTANIGHAAAEIGVNTTMVGLYGNEKLDPLFEPLAEISTMISLGDSATTHVFEFDDGKMLMTDMGAMLTMTWNRMVDALGKEKLIGLFTDADIIGVGYWSLLPAFDDIVSEICTCMEGKTRRFFFDFADIRKRDEASLVNSLNNLKSLNHNFPMTLSVNEHEAVILFNLCNETMDDKGKPLAEKTELVRKHIGLDELVIHTPHLAVAASASDQGALVPHSYVEKPVRTAGAGDTFNGGYIAGTLANLNITERLYVANAAVTHFLNTGFPPSKDKLISIMLSEL